MSTDVEFYSYDRVEDLSIMFGEIWSLFVGAAQDFIASLTVMFVLKLMILPATAYYYLWHRRKNLPPGPMPLPLLGNLLSLYTAEPHRPFLSWREKYGPIYTIFYPKPIVIICDHKSIMNVFANPQVAHKTSGRPKGNLWTAFMGKQNKDGDGIILAEGERWVQNRKFAMNFFMAVGYENIEQRVAIQVDRMVAHMTKLLNGAESCVIDVHPVLAFAVGNVIQDLILGETFDFGDEQFEKFKQLIDAVLKAALSPGMVFANNYSLLMYMRMGWSFLTNGFSLQRWFLSKIEGHERILDPDQTPQDFMDHYLRNMLKLNNPHFTKLSLCLSAGDLWTGGMETTVTTLRWFVIYLVHYPDVQRKCREELDQVVGRDRSASCDDEQSCHYIQATIAELQRITNVLPWAIPHRALEDIEVDGHFIPAGTDLLPAFGAVLYDPEVFPEPTVFDPERFLENGNFKMRAEFTPFGVGPRKCAGEKLGRMELFLFVAAMIQKFSYSAKDDTLPSLKRYQGMTSVPADFECVLTRIDK